MGARVEGGVPPGGGTTLLGRTGQFAEVCPPPQYMCDGGSESTALVQ